MSNSNIKDNKEIKFHLKRPTDKEKWDWPFIFLALFKIFFLFLGSFFLLYFQKLPQDKIKYNDETQKKRHSFWKDSGETWSERQDDIYGLSCSCSDFTMNRIMHVSRLKGVTFLSMEDLTSLVHAFSSVVEVWTRGHEWRFFSFSNVDVFFGGKDPITNCYAS